MSTVLDPLEAALLGHLDTIKSEWLLASLATISSSDDAINDLLNMSTTSRRTLGDDVLDAELFGSLSVTDAARILFIAAAAHVPVTAQDDTLKRLKDYYRYGDEHEKSALLKGLSLIDTTGFSVSLAINACRVNSLLVFKAIAEDNVYPSLYFPELNWNQLVLKSLFQGIDISNIEGLRERQNANLSKMCLDYAEELRLANRALPDSIFLAINMDDLSDVDQQKALNYRPR